MIRWKFLAKKKLPHKLKLMKINALQNYGVN